ncbi:MAG: OmpA family protein [Bacteroidales bacterium]
MIIRNILILLTILQGIFSATGQVLYRIGPEHADCPNAIELYDTVYGPTTAPVGPGEAMELSSYRNDLFSFEQEHHTVWYLFEVPDHCDLLLDIVPLSEQDDYDFLIFKYIGDETCRLIRDKKHKPVRSCISRNDLKIGSRTGLSYEAKEEYIHSGPGPSYAMALPVKAGERYLLVLDNVYPGGNGHHIHLKYRNCHEPPHVEPDPPSNFLNLNIRDANTLQMIDGDISLINRTASKSEEATQRWEGTGSLITRLDRQTTYQIVVKAEGYFQSTDQVKTGADYQTYLKTIHLNRIVEGKKVSFSNILFFGGTDQFLRESYPVLDDIIQTLTDQPGIEVEIIGHVNEPYNNRSGNTPAQNQTLSEKRAQAVYQYLIRKGVDAKRLSWVGKGNSEMIYPYANTEDQMQANRRVELYIKKYGNEGH